MQEREMQLYGSWLALSEDPTRSRASPGTLEASG